MQLVVAAAPLVVTRTVVSGMSAVAYGTVVKIYKAFESDQTLSGVEEELSAMHVRTDIEIIGALLSDVSDSAEQNKSIRVCLNHLHEGLCQMNKTLNELNTAIETSASRWSWRNKSIDPVILDRIRRDKTALDHHLMRIVQLHQLVVM